MKLSKRLKLLLEQVPAGSRLADIGSDHALLPSAAVESGVCVSAVAGEVNLGPFQAAEKQVREAGLSGSISVRLGNGLEVIMAGEVDVITIAGMGGGLISSILDKGKDKLAGVSKLVLQPNVGEDTLRQWLLQHGWVLEAEHMLEEDGKIYEILAAVPESIPGTYITNEVLYRDYKLEGGPVLTGKWLLRFGPLLVKLAGPVFHRKWQIELEKMEMILRSLAKSELTSAEEKAEAIREDMKFIKEVLSCLPKVKL